MTGKEEKRGQTMADVRDEEILSAAEEIFGDRIKRRPLGGGESSVENALALVSPINSQEVELLSEVAGRFSVQLVGLGAQTASAPTMQSRSILVRFDLMGDMRFPGSDEPWVEVEPGATLLGLENNLEARGAGLAVYPTSAPRATVGGWLAMDGLGVGSFEYGWLSENVLSADVVLAGGERREVRGEELLQFGQTGETTGIVVSATLRTRRADTRVLPAAETYHVWGERFFPVAPSRPAPTSTERMLVTLAETKQALISAQDRSANVATQGTVARTGEVLLLTFDAQEEGWAS
jgi:FAD/FMN-containing dehydrogenase